MHITKRAVEVRGSFMSQPFQIEPFLQDDITLFLVVLSLTILGSYVKDVFSRKQSRRKTTLPMIYSSAVIMTILIFATSDIIMKYFPGRNFLAVCVVGGLVSVEVVQRLTTLGGIKKFIDEFIEFYKKKK
jgi:hypothetical protein